MKRTLVLLALCCGCNPPPQINDRQVELLGECFAVAAYDAIAAEKFADPAPQPPGKCCGKCVNGKVRSGDGIAWVDCPCPDTCKCKSLIPPKGYSQ